MKNDDVLTLFFSKSYEKQLNEAILDDVDYEIDQYGLLNYVANVIAVPYKEFLEYLLKHNNHELIESRHITQSSSFDACEKEMIDVFLSEDNRGLTFVEIGKHFKKYIRSDKDGAFRKYGENQVKTSEQLGLAFEYYKCWYLNCIGYIYNDLSSEDRQSLIARNLLRDPLYKSMMLDILKNDVDIVSYMTCLDSNETRLRRYDSVKRLFIYCLSECDKEGIHYKELVWSKPDLETKVMFEKRAKKNQQPKMPVKDYDYIDVFDQTAYIAADNSYYYGNKDALLENYKTKFQSMNCFKQGGKPEPYKALMLLSVMSLIAKGVIKENRIEPSKDLKNEYETFSKIMNYDRDVFKPPFDKPFIHLQGEGFWHIKRKTWADNALLRSITNIGVIDCVRLDDELYELFLNPKSREALSSILKKQYFEN